MKYAIILFLFFMIPSCKKAVQQVQENFIVTAMTTGQWKVTSFIKGNVDTTAIFNTYQFQFKANNTVDAISNSVIINTGTWYGDINNITISANFVTTSTTLQLLNGLWKITNSSQISVEATQTVNGQLIRLKLNKT